MRHQDIVFKIPTGFKEIASSDNSDIAAPVPTETEDVAASNLECHPCSDLHQHQQSH